MKKVSVWFLVLLLFICALPKRAFAHQAYQLPEASQGQINEALTKTVPIRFLPDHPLYMVITIKETISRATKPSSALRARFDLVLSGKRLKESYLLMQKGNYKDASKNLLRYGGRLEKMIGQLEKARSQNQDVVSLVDQIAEDLRVEETLFYAINIKFLGVSDGFGFDENFASAFESFKKAVLEINDIKPGLKDRFKSVTNLLDLERQIIYPAPAPAEGFLEASHSNNPRRIIF